MSDAYRLSKTPELYDVPPTPEDIDVDELSAFYDKKEKDEVEYRVAVEAHEAWKARKLKAEKDAEAAEEKKRKLDARQKKLAELKAAKELAQEKERLRLLELEKERKAAEMAKAKQLAEEKEKEEELQRLAEVAKQKPRTPEPADDDDDDDEEGRVLKRQKLKGKQKAVPASTGPSKRKVKSKGYVVDSGEEESAGPSEDEAPRKRSKADPVPKKGDIEYVGKGKRFSESADVLTDLKINVDAAGPTVADVFRRRRGDLANGAGFEKPAANSRRRRNPRD